MNTYKVSGTYIAKEENKKKVKKSYELLLESEKDLKGAVANNYFRKEAAPEAIKKDDSNYDRIRTLTAVKTEAVKPVAKKVTKKKVTKKS